MPRCRVKHSKPHCRLRLLNFQPLWYNKVKFIAGIPTSACQRQFLYADQVDQHDIADTTCKLKTVQAQTTGNVSQKIHQVPNGREMALDQSTAKIRKHSNKKNKPTELSAFYTWARNIASLKSTLEFTGRNIRPCKEPKENASAHSKWARQYETGIIPCLGEAREKLTSKKRSMAASESVYIFKNGLINLQDFRNIPREHDCKKRGSLARQLVSWLIARIVGEIVEYRLYASVRCQRTQARSRLLSSSRAKATAAGSGGEGNSGGSGGSYISVHRTDIYIEREGIYVRQRG
ncbi:hypothetical protein EAG_06266 [Camponotus floridanus]|uniref:Uncharacterized protein n=1 Tax=Camponotus floridanus TaxID=104421 RepID=E2A651_CAMFO|nr:hypothetical protein EAG_06266 [Camponotus floridanus]